MRSTLEELRDQRLLEAFAAGRASIADDLVFPGGEENGYSELRERIESWDLRMRGKEAGFSFVRKLGERSAFHPGQE